MSEMSTCYMIKKVLNNNVLIAKNPNHTEVVLLGKGIGFNKTKGDFISEGVVEKMFILTDEQKQKQYKSLINFMDEKLMGTLQQAIYLISERTGCTLNEQIHIGLTDHLIFAIKRIREGYNVDNPFLQETKAMYPEYFRIAQEVIDLINKEIDINLPIEEVGFVTLHIVSNLSMEVVSEVNKFSQIIKELVIYIEDYLKIEIDKESIHYSRLVRHLRFLIDRIFHGNSSEESPALGIILKKEYPVCYDLAWKILKSIEVSLSKKASEAEVIYLTLHLERLVQSKINK
ncbi:glucose PTS transporter transcription antiterminator GlcT [Bacillus sp. AFS041924]|uniref:glucose PTS transporter transcription antiterminator GlcT n=1 Tax=Bacillus sp. AFS041924 TaxID=2033503 RepID=UPI0026B1990B|nr:PRD domain-containing protein [Bacillus sp. AFS041924]